MGEIAEGLLNGDFDFYTGEYMGRGYGIPRTKNKSLAWEKQNKRDTKKNVDGFTIESSYNGVKKYISKKWNGRDDMPNIRELLYEYTGERNFDIKKKCVDIQKDFGAFIKFINLKLKEKKQ